MSKEDFHPFPDYEDRTFWQSLPDSIATYYLDTAKSLLNYRWPVIPASVFLEFKTTGNRRHFEGYYKARRAHLQFMLFAELIENDGKYMEQIMNVLWLIMEESTWSASAHIGMQKIGVELPDPDEHIVDLYAARTAQLLAWVNYLLKDKLDQPSKILRKRIHYEVKRRILDPCLERKDYRWMGYNEDDRRPNNWNPWISSNWLACNLLLEHDEQRRKEATLKIIEVVDNFLNPHPEDGGCDEGPGYWNHAAGSLFDVLELMRVATNGQFDIYEESIIENMGSYIYKAYINHPYFLNFADANPQIKINGPHVFRYGKAVQNDKMMFFGAFGSDLLTLEEIISESNMARNLFLYAQFDEIFNHPEKEVLVRDVWLPDIQVMAARMQQGSVSGIYLAAKGGHNAESHNHNDIGNFIIYVDGEPAIIDAGRGTYTSKTFSSHRYELWFNNSSYHNLPMIGEYVQLPGRKFEARDVQYQSDHSFAGFSLDLAKAFPAASGVERWNRTLNFHRKKRQVVLIEEYQLGRPVNSITEHFMTTCRVVESGNCCILLHSVVDDRPILEISFEPGLEYSIERLQLDQPEDARIKEFWGEDIYRIALKDKKPETSGTYTIKFFKK